MSPQERKHRQRMIDHAKEHEKNAEIYNCPRCGDELRVPDLCTKIRCSCGRRLRVVRDGQVRHGVYHDLTRLVVA